MEQTLTVYISEHHSGYFVQYCLDAMPPHQTDGPYPTVESAKASVTVPVTWSDPDSECTPDVAAVGQ